MAVALGLAGLFGLALGAQRGALAPDGLGPLAAGMVGVVFLCCAVATWARGPVGGVLGILAAGPALAAIDAGRQDVPWALVRLHAALGSEGFVVALAVACGVLAMVLGVLAEGVGAPPEPKPRYVLTQVAAPRPRRTWGR